MNLNQPLPPVPPLPADVDGLLRFLTDPAATKKRLAELAKATSEAAGVTAQANAAIDALALERRQQHDRLATALAEHDHRVAAALADIETRRADLGRREQELAAARAEVDSKVEYAAMLKAEAAVLGRSINEVLAADWDAMRGGAAHAA
jgi:hypothetical protein